MLLDRDLEEGRVSRRSRGHGDTGTYRWVRDLSPLKVNLDRVWMSLFSMNLRTRRSDQPLLRRLQETRADAHRYWRLDRPANASSDRKEKVLELRSLGGEGGGECE